MRSDKLPRKALPGSGPGCSMLLNLEIISCHLAPRLETSSVAVITIHSFDEILQLALPCVMLLIRTVLSTAPLPGLQCSNWFQDRPYFTKHIDYHTVFSSAIASSPLKLQTLAGYAMTPAGNSSAADVYFNTMTPPASVLTIL